MAKIGFSPPSLFFGLGAVAAGAALAAGQPGSRAIMVLDWPRTFLVAVPVLVALFLLERCLSRAYRRAEPASYPSSGPVLIGLFGLSIALVALVNGNLGHSSRVVRPPVHGWLVEDRAIPTMFGVPQSQSAAVRAKSREARVAVAAWWDPEAEIRLPITEEQLRTAEEPGPHAVEVIVARGLLGMEYVEAVRVVAGGG